MRFVIDASIVFAWAFGDEAYPAAMAALEPIRVDDAVAASPWWFELRNALIVSERRGPLGEADSSLFLRERARFAVTIDRALQESEVLALARRHRLTVYDAVYLELAQRLAPPRTTLVATCWRRPRCRAWPGSDPARTQGSSMLRPDFAARG